MTSARPSSASASGKTNDGSGPRRVLRLIEALCRSDEPLRLADLASAAALSKPTAHRLLGVLAAEGWAVSHEGGRYGVGPSVRALGAAVTGTRTAQTVEALIDELRGRVRQTVHVGMHSGDHIIYTHKVEGDDQPFAMASRVGMLQPLHSTAIGKCVLTDFDDAALAALAARTGLEQRTAHTLTTLDALREELAGIRTRGFAVDEQENEANIRCIAAPVRGADGRTVGAVSVSTVTFVVERADLLALREDVMDTARRLERLLA